MSIRVMGIVALAGLAQVASGQTTYNDSTFDVFDNPPDRAYDHLDISSVTVSHDATNINFTINVRGNADSRDWAKFCVGIDTGAAGGSSTNGWGRNIDWAGQGIDFWIGSWVDGGGGAELRAAPGWNLLAATYNGDTTIGGSFNSPVTQRTLSVSRALLGLTGNDTFRFDVVTTGGGGGDPGVDHLSVAGLATPGWGTASVAGTFLSYTIPTPGAASLLALGGLLAARRRR
ncbi:MAG: hypothetical protein SFY69_07335 [Planctomycetota bacterium]|nr:hypothetical protein [Planctomycetota bacterium]